MSGYQEAPQNVRYFIPSVNILAQNICQLRTVVLYFREIERSFVPRRDFYYSIESRQFLYNLTENWQENIHRFLSDRFYIIFASLPNNAEFGTEPFP